MKEAKGSITIFSLLTMMLVASALFSLLEGVRFAEITRLTKWQSQIALESLFADYESRLWGKYRILACEKENMQEKILKYANERLEYDVGGINFFQFQGTNVIIEEITRLTDGEGAAYVNLVSSYMKENITYEMAQSIFSRYEGIKEMMDTSIWDWSEVEDALEQIDEVKQDLEKNSTGLSVQTSGNSVKKTQKVQEDLLGTMAELKKKGVLELVIEDTDTLSDKKLDVSNVVSKRELEQGNELYEEEIDWMDRILFQQYLLKYLSNYCEETEDGGVAYELEYLIGQKASDIENLKSVVYELLAIREAANVCHIMADASKMNEAQIIAAAIAGISANGAVIEAVKMGLIMAWAFAESVLDVRALLRGQQIALIKSSENWTLDLDKITNISNKYMVAESCENGLAYKDYLGILLLFAQAEETALYAMDVQEAYLQITLENPEFYLDEYLIAADVSLVYEYEPVFLMIQFLNIQEAWEYQISANAKFTYE